MKATFKPLSLAVAVATASAGYAGIVNAQVLADNEGLGDLAIVPYYTVQSGWSTGISVINSSDATQVVKVRMRRAVDSMDALDFNVVMSPQDVWTGYLEKASDGVTIRFFTNDTSCVVPDFTAANYFEMPNIYRVGAEEGYMEIMAMGSPINESQPIAIAAKHVDGVPRDCDRVRDNFFRGTTPNDYYLSTADALNSPDRTRTRGVINSALTWQYAVSEEGAVLSDTPTPSSYTDADNVLKVSYFIKDDNSGTEFGSDAVHIADFMDGASITNQRVGINEGDLQGFDHPDLNGGAPTSVLLGVEGAAAVGSYEAVREALGAQSVINDWSANQSDLFTVDTDWVITTPGQYLMTNAAAYIDALEGADEDEVADGNLDGCQSGNLPSITNNGEEGDPDEVNPYNPVTGANCDFRDIPLTVRAEVYDREELGIVAEEDDLVISPTPPGETPVVNFNREVNVVSWGIESVLDSDKNIIVPVPEGGEAGWARVSVTASSKQQGICEFTNYGVLPLPVDCEATSTPVPLIGFVAWQRNFGANPDANYGRVIEHSFSSEVVE